MPPDLRRSRGGRSASCDLASQGSSLCSSGNLIAFGDRRIFAAAVSAPDGIELLDERFDKCGVVGENAVLEIALLLRLCTHPGTGEIRRAEVGLHTVNHSLVCGTIPQTPEV